MAGPYGRGEARLARGPAYAVAPLIPTIPARPFIGRA